MELTLLLKDVELPTEAKGDTIALGSRAGASSRQQQSDMPERDATLFRYRHHSEGMKFCRIKKTFALLKRFHRNTNQRQTFSTTSYSDYSAN
ncbi:hypothetical protein DV515_00005811 [Chloebia gouldiae]|uniref:Uncharacterized protein n=1 Tax=Chloebia gouldiae TaxID=44316 RepID=A0A3L8SM47_CHLGU|nr:hypothetical protein DV515_00005811 [Chloebia gouldiae]